jgi:ABC-type enterobactin transport system permease subunit
MTEILKWVGTALTIAGAITTSLAIDPLNVYLFNAGAVTWLLAAIRMKEKSLIVVNAGLLAVYLFGIFYRIV